jgi:hypothetical protein
VDLSAFNPGTVPLTFTATDAVTDLNGQVVIRTTSAYVEVIVETSSMLTEVETVSGLIMDADCSRILLADGVDIKLYDRATRQYTVIAPNMPLYPGYLDDSHVESYSLTPGGALLLFFTRTP